MLRQLFNFLFLLLLFSCKKEAIDVPVNDYMHSISGQWNLSQREKGTYGKKYWEDARATSKDHLIFLESGTIVDLDSLPVCCQPNYLQINKVTIEIKPSPQVAPNPVCALVQCIGCTTWDLEWAKNMLIITYCDGTRLKYIKA